MIDKQQIRQAMARVGSLPEPVVSLYINTNPARPGSSPRAVAKRAKSTLDALEVPRSVVEKVVHLLDSAPPRARTLAVFADDQNLEVVQMDVELPIQDAATGHVEARWGAPYVTPLLVALDESEHYGVLHLGRDRWRLFAVALGSIEEIAQEERTLTEGEEEALQRARQEFPTFVPHRGTSIKDDAHDHVEDLARRFYMKLANRLEHLMGEREMPHLIALGPERDVTRLLSVLPPQLRERVAATLPSVPNPDCSAGEILTHVSNAARELKAKHEEKLLCDIREQGITGVNECLVALQQGQVQVLAVPWPVTLTVYRDAETGYVAATAGLAHASRPDGMGEVSEVSFADVLPALATAFNTQVEFIVEGAHKQQLDQFGGMGAIARWGGFAASRGQQQDAGTNEKDVIHES